MFTLSRASEYNVDGEPKLGPVDWLNLSDPRLFRPLEFSRLARPILEEPRLARPFGFLISWYESGDRY